MYLKGLLWGGGVPLVLYEVVERIFGALHWKFLVWGGIDLILLGGAIWAVRKGYWVGLGVLWVFCGMLPFASTAWNGVEAYVSWEYLYVPLVGVAWVLGGLAEGCWKVGRRKIRLGVVVAGCVLVGVYGYRQGVLNGVLRSEGSYWRYVYELAPNERVSVALGKAYLEEGDEEKALAFLFSPYVKQLKTPCCEMSWYYSDRGDLAAAAVHLNMSVGEDVGMQFQGYEMARAIWCYKSGALDYAEDALGKITTANPLNAEAVILLSRVWMIKNHIRAARRSLSGVLRIAPFDRGLLRAVEQLEERAHKNTVFTVPPPDPSMLRYALQRIREGPVPGEIVRAGARHPEDPVLQMEAGVCLIREGKVDSALAKLDFATQRLSACAYVWATKCWAEVQAGAYEEALITGQRALELDPKNGAVHSVLGFVYEKQVRRPEDLERAVWYYQHALQLTPRNAAVHNNLGELLIRQGKFEKAAEHFRQALRVRPDYAESHHNLGNILMREGKFREAILSFEQALRLRPDFMEARSNLGVAFLQEGRMRECEEQFRRVLRVRPDQDKAWENLGTVLIRQGRYREAADLFRRWMRLAPDRPRAILSTAWLLASCPDADVRNGKEAIRLAERVCRAGRYRSAGALGVLAAAYAEEGRFGEAVRYAGRAFERTKAGGRDKLMHQIEAQLKLYRSHRPYRMQP
jgi:tetratricopeptide (TPR) repeat protein